MFLAISDFWLNIGDAFNELFKNIEGWNWDNIMQYVQNIGLPTILLFGLRYIYPLIKNSKKKELEALEKQLDILNQTKMEILNLRQEDRTIKTLITKWIELQSEINVNSKTLTLEQKQKFIDIANGLREIDSEKTKDIADKIDEMVSDNKITSDEAIELAEENETVKEIFGTNIDNLIPKGDTSE